MFEVTIAPSVSELLSMAGLFPLVGHTQPAFGVFRYSLTVGLGQDETLKVSRDHPFHPVLKEAYQLVDEVDPELGEAWFQKVSPSSDFDLYCFLAGPGSWLVSQLLQARHFGAAKLPLGGPRAGQAVPASVRHKFTPAQFLDWVADVIGAAYRSEADTAILPAGGQQLYVVSHHDEVTLKTNRSADIDRAVSELQT
jgi:hypothetical protein